MIIHSNLFIRLISWFMKPTAITLWPFIIISPKRIKEQATREKTSEEAVTYFLINHEKIHLQQQKELYVIGFYVLYLYYFLKYLIRYRNFKSAYRYIPFEQEAYDKQYTLKYLEKRPPYIWKEYVA